MSSCGVNTQRFIVATNSSIARNLISEKLANVSEFVIKAQIKAGGRGKGVFLNGSGLRGGVHLKRDTKEVGQLVDEMVGNRLVTKQTGPDGELVEQVMVAEAKDPVRETYFAIVLDRSAGGPVLVGSPRGGVDIEETARLTPQAILTEPVEDPIRGPTEAQLKKMVRFLQLERFEGRALEQMKRLYDLFVKADATQVEVNPFGVTRDDEILCFDAKIDCDDNAVFRQSSIASKHQDASSNYLKLDGNIGCLVNGAGLAMATMDILAQHGGKPANFLDVGGNATTAIIQAAYRQLLEDDNVACIFVNIFGGIMRCDLIVEGILGAMARTPVMKPLVVRLIGTNEYAAREKLQREYPGSVYIHTDFDEAAKQACLCSLGSRKEALLHSSP